MADRLDNFRVAFEEQLQLLLLSNAIPSGKLREAAAYSCLGAGKRIRPALLQAFSEMSGGIHSGCLKDFQLAVELIHCSTLIHDDLPALDNDIERRGRPTTHVAFDEATAIMAGDALLLLPAQILFERLRECLRTSNYELAERVTKASQSLQIMAVQVCHGQTLDVSGGYPAVEVRTYKTASLFLLLGQIVLDIAGREEGACEGFLDLAVEFGDYFQRRDDYLDAVGDATRKQRSGSSDKRNRKENEALSLDWGETLGLLQQMQSQLLEKAEALSQQLGGSTGLLREIVAELDVLGA